MGERKYNAAFLNETAVQNSFVAFGTYLKTDGPVDWRSLVSTITTPYFGSELYTPISPDDEELNKRYLVHYYPDDPDKTRTELLNLYLYRQRATNYFVSCKWMRNGKILYRPDKAFAEVLIETESLSLRTEDFRRLPFLNFYIDLANVDMFKNERISGVYVSVLFLHYSEDKTIRKQQMHACVLYQTIGDAEGASFYGGQITLEKAAEPDFWEKYSRNGVDPSHQNAELVTGLAVPQSERLIRAPINIWQLERFILQFVQYLISDKADVQETERSARIRNRLLVNPTDDKKEHEYEVGVRIGQQLTMIKRARCSKIQIDEDSPDRNGFTHSSPIPHMRRAHWHKYHHGAGKKEIKTVWLLPILVNGVADDMSVSVREAKKQQSDGYKGEVAVEECLKSLGVKYERQKHIRETNRFYDFCIVKNGRKMMIEFDGEQHFKPVTRFGGKEKYHEQIRTDQEKTEWCRKKKIPLLRIRYDQKSVIPSMINDLLKKPQKYVNGFNTYLSDKQYYSIRK